MVLDSLHHVSQVLPAEDVIDFNRRNLRVSRTSASLHLDLFQAIILSIRPVMFHLLRRKIRESRSDIPPPERCPLDLVRLTGICREAASKILKVLLAMENDGTLLWFGIWDLDALVTASFVFGIDSVISPSLKGQQSAQLSEAHRIVCRFAQTGNETAARRARDIEHLIGLSGPSGSVQSSGDANATPNSWNLNQILDWVEMERLMLDFQANPMHS